MSEHENRFSIREDGFQPFLFDMCKAELVQLDKGKPQRRDRGRRADINAQMESSNTWSDEGKQKIESWWADEHGLLREGCHN